MKLDVKFFRQTKGYCGPTSVRIVLNYYGFKKTEKEIAEVMGVERKVGTDLPQMFNGLNKLGFKAYYKKNSSLKELSKFISQGIPVVIYWNRNGEGHYSVVFGFKAGKVFIADPSKSRIISMNKENFLRKWVDVDNKDDKREIIVIEKS